MHVLIVEDDLALAQLYRMMVASQGAATTVITEDFEDFFKDIDWHHVDAILCDQQLGTYSGNAILKRVREEHPNVVRVMVTANVLANEEETYSDRLLQKPTESLVILEALGLL